MIGEQIRQYRIHSRLGSGGMGEVYLAEDERLGREVALKFLSADLGKDEHALERFRNEARLSAGLSHPHIASIHGFEEADGRWFHVQEYVKGDTLQEIIDRGPVDLALVRELAVDLARALAHAHSRGVIHRDLKPANIIVTPDSGAKILDFGLARRSGASGPTLPGVALGTVAYMSPEQIRGEPVDQRCDLWALGAVLYQALAGQPPFAAQEIPAQLHHILNEEPPSLAGLRPDTPDDLRRVVEGCLKKDRDQRMGSGEEILSALGLSADMRQALPAASGQGGTPRWTWIAGAVVVVAIAVFGIMKLSGGSSDDPPAESLAETVTVEDEFGQTTVQTVPSGSYRQRVVLFFADSVEGADDAQWLRQGIPHLIAIDLSQDPFLVAQTPQHFIELMRREGRPDGLDLARPLQRKIAREQMAAAFVTYAITVEEDGSYALTQEVHETESGRLLDSRTLRDADPFALADQASMALRTDLKVPEVLAGEYPDLPVSEISTASVEAYRAFTEGLVSLAFDNDFAAAGGHFRAATSADSTFALAHMNNFVVASLTQDMEGMRESADLSMEHLYRLPPKVQFAMKANYYMNIEQDPDKALAVTRMWSQLHPGDEDAFRQLATFHMLRNEREEQVAALEQVVAIDPTDFNTLQTIGTVYRDMGRHEDAARWLERFVETYPSRASGRIELAELYVDMGDRGRAREELERALLLEDRNPEALLGLADIALREGDTVAVREHLDRALRAAGTALERAEVHDEYSQLAMYEGKVHEALERLESTRAARAEALPPTQVVISTIAGRRLYATVGEGEEGLARAREDRLLLAPIVRGAAGIGLVPLFVELGEADSARVHLQGVATFVETYKLELLRPMILMMEAQIAELDGDFETALERIDAAIGDETPSGRRLRLRARALRNLGRLDEAEATLERAALLDPADPVTRIERARLYQEQRRRDDAVAELQAALRTWKDADPEYEYALEARALLESVSN